MTNNSYSFLFKFEFFRSLQTKSFLILFQYTTGRLPTGDIMARHEAVQEFVEPSGEDGKRHTYIIWTALFSFWHNILRTPTHLFEFYSSFFYDQPKIRLAKSFLLLNFFFFSCQVDTPPPPKKKKISLEKSMNSAAVVTFPLTLTETKKTTLKNETIFCVYFREITAVLGTFHFFSIFESFGHNTRQRPGRIRVQTSFFFPDLMDEGWKKYWVVF